MSEPFDYLQAVDPSHVSSCAKALKELANLISTPAGAGQGAAQLVKFGHVDHGGFLNPLLFGFSMQHVSPDGEVGGEGADPGEVLYAVVVNQKLDVQIRTALESVSNLLYRRELLDSVRTASGGIEDVIEAASRADRQTSASLDDQFRASDWRTVAGQIRDRATAAGIPLQVEFASPLLTQPVVRDRVPALRRVYNEFPLARDAVDRVAAVLSQGLTVAENNASEAAMHIAQEILDVGQVRTFLAHLARDAFVCGNGYLDMRTPTTGLRLLRPEVVEHLASGALGITDQTSGARTTTPLSAILHIPALRQPGSEIGLSGLEPLLTMQVQQDVADSVVAEGVPLALEQGSPEALAWVAEVENHAAQTRTQNERRAKDILGVGPRTLPDAPADLYFQGQTLMQPASPPLRHRDLH